MKKKLKNNILKNKSVILVISFALIFSVCLHGFAPDHFHPGEATIEDHVHGSYAENHTHGEKEPRGMDDLLYLNILMHGEDRKWMLVMLAQILSIFFVLTLLRTRLREFQKTFIQAYKEYPPSVATNISNIILLRLQKGSLCSRLYN